MRSRFLLILTALFLCLPLSGRQGEPERIVTWTVSSAKISPEVYRVTLAGTLLPGYHIYDTHDKYSATELTVSPGSGFTAGALQEAKQAENGEYHGKAVFYFDVRVNGTAPVRLEASICWTACRSGVCGFPDEYAFSLDLGD